MMKFDVLTLFPDMFPPVLGNSIIGRAKDKGLIELNYINIRDFSTNKHRKVDHYPYGGGAGMLMQAQPVYDACMSVLQREQKSVTKIHSHKIIYTTPQGKMFTQSKARKLAKEAHIIIICGHYEGIDQRVIDELEASEISIGNYILTGGELAAMVIVDAVSRLVDGVLPSSANAIETFCNHNAMEAPQYTRPAVWRGREVPQVLMNGNHKLINEWQRQQSIDVTKRKRPRRSRAD